MGDEMKTRSALTVLLLSIIATSGLLYSKSQNIPLAWVTGIWKKSYSPDLKNVTEIDERYLVLTPDYKFYSFEKGYDNSESILEGIFQIEGNQVILTNKKYYNKENSKPPEYKIQDPDDIWDWSTRTLYFHRNTEIVTFDAINNPKYRDVLAFKDSLNYSFSKEY